MKYIDLNCDMGEGGDFDDKIMLLITSCNIACAGHAGDKETIAKTVASALEHQVAIGAHPSYPDKDHFGRKSIEIKPSALKNTLLKQIERVLEEVKRQGGEMKHVKPHGALYNDLKYNEERADLVVETIREIDSNLILLVPPHSILKTKAEKNLKIKVEGFADRCYQSDFRLTPRSSPHAVLTDKRLILKQVLNMVLNDHITLKDGTVLTHKFDTLCVHSDTQNSLDILTYLNEQLPLNNIQLNHFRL